MMRVFSRVVFTGALVALPLFVQAQSADLQTTIRQALLSDPRTASLSAVQIDAMVQILVEEAERRGISSQDINWRPQQYDTFAEGDGVASSCGNIPSFLCSLNQAFGFDGSDPTIAIGLGITSALLIVIIGLMLEMKRRAAASLARSAAPPPHFQ